MTTIITCPKCTRATHTASLTGDQASGQHVSESQRYMTLTCQGCGTQLMFVVEMLPEFNRIVESIGR